MILHALRAPQTTPPSSKSSSSSLPTRTEMIPAPPRHSASLRCRPSRHPGAFRVFLAVCPSVAVPSPPHPGHTLASSQRLGPSDVAEREQWHLLSVPARRYQPRQRNKNRIDLRGERGPHIPLLPGEAPQRWGHGRGVTAPGICGICAICGICGICGIGSVPECPAQVRPHLQPRAQGGCGIESGGEMGVAWRPSQRDGEVGTKVRSDGNGSPMSQGGMLGSQISHTHPAGPAVACRSQETAGEKHLEPAWLLFPL